MRPPSRLSQAAPWIVVLASVLLMISGVIRGRHPDEEEYRSVILTTMLHGRALIDGVYPFWTSALAFGLPHPLSPAIIFHPLVLLFGVAPPEVAASVLYVVHALVGAAGSWWLIRSVGGGRWACALGAVTWMLSAPSQNYLLTDFWPAEFVVWSLAPFLVLGALGVLFAPPGRQPLMAAAGFGLTAGLMWANGHPGYLPVLFVPLVVMFAAHPRRTRRTMPALAVAVSIGLLIAAPTLLHLLTEVGRFPMLERVTDSQGLGFAHAWDLLFRPLSLATPAQMYETVLSRGTRVPFYGGPMFVLSLCYAAGRLAPPPYQRGVVAAFLSAFAMLTLPLGSSRLFSATYLFRDAVIIFGIVLGTLAWQALSLTRPRLAAWVAAAQVLLLVGAALPLIRHAGESPDLGRWAVRETPVTQALQQTAVRYPGRWYLSPAVDDLATRQQLLRDGLGQNGWPYRGLPIVNGTFKGVSADPFYPSARLPYGQIRGDAATVNSAPLLTALGISVVLAVPGEAVATSLQEVDRLSTYEAGTLRVLRNPSVWPGAVFVGDDIISTALRRLPECGHSGLLCADFAPVIESGRSTDVRVSQRHGSIDVSFAADRQPRWLLVAEMYRPGWRAAAGRHRANVVRALGGLVAVHVPAGATSVALTFRPVAEVVTASLAWLTILCVAGVLVAGRAGGGRTPRAYFYELLARYIGYHLPSASRVVEFAPRTPLLGEAIGRSQWLVAHTAVDLRGLEPDRIILSGTLHYTPDIQTVLEGLHAASGAETRLIIVYYNSLWRPLLRVARRIGLAGPEPEHNWVSPSDVENLLRLSGFELLSQSSHILLPAYLPLLSTLINRWLAPLPVLRWFAVMNLAVARRLPQPADRPLSVSIVVPARNERGNIASIIERTPQMGPDDELIFVEGGSSDGTWDEIQSAIAANAGRRIVALQQPGKGKGDAVRAGFDKARGDLLMILDADLTVPPEDLPKFYRALTSGVGEFVNGSRLVYPMDDRAMQFANILGNKFFALAFSFLLGQPLKDTLCGSKALSRAHYQRIAHNRLYFGDFDPFGDFDLLFGASKLDLRIVELPIRYRERIYGTTNIQRWSHGLLLARMTLFAARKIKFI